MKSYKGQIAGLVDGSADILMIENTTDTLNPKADVYAVDEYFDETSEERLPVMLSVQTVDNSGCTLSGQTEKAFYVIACMKEWYDIQFFYYVSSHKIQNRYNTGATTDKLESNIAGANNTSRRTRTRR